MVGAVGDDPNGRAIAELLAGAGIEADLVVVPGWRTTLKERIVSRRKQLLRMDFELPLPAEMADAVASRAAKHIGAADAVILEDYDKGALATPGHIIELARKQAVPTVADPSSSPSPSIAASTSSSPTGPSFNKPWGTGRTSGIYTKPAARWRASVA